MTLESLVQPLISEGDSTARFFRAIKLFEFQIALFHPHSFGLLVNSESNITAPTRMLKTARIFAAIKILENIEAALKTAKRVSLISIRDLAADENYRGIFDDVIAANGGWSRMRHSMSAREFDENVDARSEEARAAANVVDFSYRFSISGAPSQKGQRKNPGGLDAARYVVRQARPYKSAMSETAMKNRWREYRSTAIFLYLVLNQKFDLKPPRVASKNFLENLLRQSDDVDKLRRFFRAYQMVRLALSDLKYADYPLLDLDLHSSVSQLEAPTFSPEVQLVFNRWVGIRLIAAGQSYSKALDFDSPARTVARIESGRLLRMLRCPSDGQRRQMATSAGIQVSRDSLSGGRQKCVNGENRRTNQARCPIVAC